jgi:anthranilate phosphoribosyltransferase
MKYVQPIRKSLGFRTVFNILGPLANPARATAQVLGVGDETLMEQIAEVLKLLGSRFAMVVHSNGLDEISTASVTKILELKDGQITEKELNAAEFGFTPPSIDQLKVADAKTSAKVLRDILGDKEKGPRKDIIVLNAAAAIIVGNLAQDFKQAIEMADTSVGSGKALECLEKFIEVSNKE